jgi:hypothetical protein
MIYLDPIKFEREIYAIARRGYSVTPKIIKIQHYYFLHQFLLHQFVFNLKKNIYCFYRATESKDIT